MYKPLLIGMMLLFFQQFCGINAVQFYLNEIFKKSSTTLSPKVSTLIANIFMCLATVLGGAVIDRAGRRLIYAVSGRFRRFYDTISKSNCIYSFSFWADVKYRRIGRLSVYTSKWQQWSGKCNNFCANHHCSAIDWLFQCCFNSSHCFDHYFCLV